MIKILVAAFNILPANSSVSSSCPLPFSSQMYKGFAASREQERLVGISLKVYKNPNLFYFQYLKAHCDSYVCAKSTFVETDSSTEIRRQLRHTSITTQKWFGCFCSTADPGCLDIWTSLSSQIPLSDNNTV